MIHCAPCFTTNTHKVRHLSNNDETYQDTFVPFKYNKNITFNFPFSNSFHCLIIKKERFCQYTHKKREILPIIRQNLSFFIFIIQNHLIIFVNYKEKKSMTPTLINPFFSTLHSTYETSCPIPLKRLNLGCERPFGNQTGDVARIFFFGVRQTQNFEGSQISENTSSFDVLRTSFTLYSCWYTEIRKASRYSARFLSLFKSSRLLQHLFSSSTSSISACFFSSAL